MKKILASIFVFIICSAALADKKSSSFKNIYFGIQTGASISADGTRFKPDTQASGEGWYVPDEGWSNQSFGTKALYGLVVGYQFNPNLSIDINYTYRNHFNWSVKQVFSSTPPTVYRNKTISDITIQTALLNFNYSPVTWNNFSPYVSLGTGVAVNKTATLNNTAPNDPTFLQTINGKTTASFAWQAGIGCNYSFNPNWRLMFGYRFLDAGRLETGNTISGSQIATPTKVQPFAVDNPKFHELLLGITYQL